ncbi:BsuPI-related putative proteinase inhibitor [Fictibacillus phosphorivorans]|uniref:BsuPI-related putative proteinase inhibitor n=1 Tax=Fictibacillus phosphorivorans TaxID=1221500 RepID=UPI001884B1BE|nr:BsuPI-related putative proteinase inhibitor [Fictibacillus phosphorivorans]
MRSIKITVIVFLTVCTFLFLMSACGKEQAKPNGKKGEVSSQLNPVLSIQQRNDGIDVLAVLENHSNHTVTLSFNSSKMFDVAITDSSNKEVFRHSKGVNYEKKQEDVHIKAGASHIWKTKWKLSAANKKAGIYRVNATFLPDEISPGSLRTESLSVEEVLTLHGGSEETKNNSFRNIHFSGKDGTYKVSGEARVFEGSFVYSVSDGHNIFIEKNEQIVEGGPDWAPFSFEVHIRTEDLPINGTLMLELFYYSPKNGEKSDTLAVPLQSFK